MSFAVDPGNLHWFAFILKKDAGVASEEQTYTTTHSTLKPGGTVFADVGASHAAFIRALTQSQVHLANLFNASASELDQAAKLYEHTDSKAAARMDSVYRDPYRNTPAPREPYLGPGPVRYRKPTFGVLPHPTEGASK
jgi:hypothetical protein